VEQVSSYIPNDPSLYHEPRFALTSRAISRIQYHPSLAISLRPGCRIAVRSTLQIIFPKTKGRNRPKPLLSGVPAEPELGQSSRCRRSLSVTSTCCHRLPYLQQSSELDSAGQRPPSGRDSRVLLWSSMSKSTIKHMYVESESYMNVPSGSC
jgi:hypothetical protein